MEREATAATLASWPATPPHGGPDSARRPAQDGAAGPLRKWGKGEPRGSAALKPCWLQLPSNRPSWQDPRSQALSPQGLLGPPPREGRSAPALLLRSGVV